MTVPAGARAWIRTQRAVCHGIVIVLLALFAHAVVRLVIAAPLEEPPASRIVRRDPKLDRLDRKSVV